MIKEKFIPDSPIRDEIIRRMQPFAPTTISSSARVVILGDPETDTYNLYISDRTNGQNLYMDSGGNVMIETFERVSALV